MQPTAFPERDRLLHAVATSSAQLDSDRATNFYNCVVRVNEQVRVSRSGQRPVKSARTPVQGNSEYKRMSTKIATYAPRSFR